MAVTTTTTTEFTLSFADGETKKITGGPYDDASEYLDSLYNGGASSPIKTFNDNINTIKTLYLSKNGAELVGVTDAKIISEQREVIYNSVG